jgi:hypothetical protein
MSDDGHFSSETNPEEYASQMMHFSSETNPKEYASLNLN